MSSDLERRLADGLGAELPLPSTEATDRARRAALAALPPPSRGARRPLLLGAALAGAAAVSAGALAASGVVTVGIRDRAAPAAGGNSGPGPALRLPPGSRGVAAVVDGRLWLTVRDGARIEGLPVTAAALSPHALYVAVGIGNSLVAMSPHGRRSWSVRVRGRVVAAAWAPDALRIAYVVRRPRGLELRIVEGDGAHDGLVATGVRGVPPVWRPDSLAVAYTGAGGRALVYDLAHRTNRALPVCGSPSEAGAVSPGVLVVWLAARSSSDCARFASRHLAGIARSGRALAVTHGRTTVLLLAGRHSVSSVDLR